LIFSIVFYILFFYFPFVRFFFCLNRLGFTDALGDCRTSYFRRFFRKITLSKKGRILQEMHFKAAESSAAVQICVWKTNR